MIRQDEFFCNNLKQVLNNKSLLSVTFRKIRAVDVLNEQLNEQTKRFPKISWFQTPHHLTAYNLHASNPHWFQPRSQGHLRFQNGVRRKAGLSPPAILKAEMALGTRLHWFTPNQFSKQKFSIRCYWYWYQWSHAKFHIFELELVTELKCDNSKTFLNMKFCMIFDWRNGTAFTCTTT